ncbi:MAG: efflux RND transporter periplasmic adaptor subunit [Alphaproteobacteria bacterium]
MTLRMIIMLIGVLLVLGGVFGYKIFEGVMVKKYMSSMGAPAQTVSTTKAEMQDWQPKLEAVGSVRAVNGADLSAEIAGIVESIHFESDSEAKKGQLLVRLRADDDIARLNSLQATAKLANITFERNQKLLKTQAISQAQVDADIANLANAAAQVAQQQAIVNKKSIHAPFKGHLGIRKVDVGQYVNPGSPIVSLQQLDPIYVDFTLPEQNLTSIQVGQKVSVRVQTHGDQVFEGMITAINSKIDESTRNIQIRATFKNPDELLLPGMFSPVIIESGAAERFVTLPQTAITFNPYGNTVYLVDNTDPAKPIAKQAFVTTGATRGDQIAILSGVKEGDEVVIAGQMKLRNGAPIKVNNEVVPTNDSNPVPTEQ